MNASGPINVLLLEDNPVDALMIREAFADATDVSCSVKHVETLEAALARAKGGRFDVALLDLGVPDSQGIDTFRRFHEQAVGLPIMILTGLDDADLAIVALKEGAQEYIVKREIQPHMLGRTVRYAMERNELHTELEFSRDRLRMLAHRLRNVREQEQQRMSREFHDQLGQKMTALMMDLSWMEVRLRELPDGEKAQLMIKRILEARRLGDSVIGTVQRIAYELRPSVLDHLGLPEAIREEARSIESRASIRMTLNSPDDLPAIDNDIATTFFRIFQELVTNVIRHAAATVVDVELDWKSGEFRLSVNDNGIGMDPDVVYVNTSLGLLGVHERAMAHGGRLHIDSSPGQGSAISVYIPAVQH